MNYKRMMLVAVTFLGLALAAQAQGLDAVKQSMLARKPAVAQLLASKTVGENRDGLLEATAKVADADAKTVAAENADRKAVYAAIAAKNGTDVAKVGQLRAAEIAARAEAGTLIQGRDGTWAGKK
ncbi:MAG: DUF1318 domain-containing protein [bacterium]